MKSSHILDMKYWGFSVENWSWHIFNSKSKLYFGPENVVMFHKNKQH